MTNPQQPALPAEPKKPYTGTGGYVGPSPRTARTPRSDGTLPGAPTPPGAPLPAPSPGASPSPVHTSPVGATAPGAAPGGAGIPPAAQNVGLDEQGYQEVLEDAKNAPEPEEFKEQFTQLMEQRNMIAPAPQGGAMPDEKYGRYLSKGLREAVAFATTPVELGGLGYTEAQAKMNAIMEARRRWPGVASQFWTENINGSGTGGKLTPSDLGVTSVGAGKSKTQIEVSPMRAARLDPEKVSNILVRKEFKTALEWANDYKERSGTGANAVDFVQDVFDTQVAKMQTGGKKLQADLEKANAQLANAEAMKAQAELGTDFAAQQKAEQAHLEAKAAKETAEAALLNTKVPDETEAMQNAVKFIEENQDVLSVAAGLAQLY